MSDAATPRGRKFRSGLRFERFFALNFPISSAALIVFKWQVLGFPLKLCIYYDRLFDFPDNKRRACLEFTFDHRFLECLSKLSKFHLEVIHISADARYGGGGWKILSA